MYMTGFNTGRGIYMYTYRVTHRERDLHVHVQVSYREKDLHVHVHV